MMTDGPQPALSIEDYDAREAEMSVSASYPALRSFAPTSFLKVGFPGRVTREAELRRYADVMYETAGNSHWLKEMRCSAQEQRDVLSLRDEVQALSGALFGKPLQPRNCLFPPLPIVRTIEAIATATGRRSLRVFEIGPGAGFLGSYLVLRGHRYMAMEVTQAFYLWNNRLLRWITGGDFQDYAGAAAAPVTLPDARASLLPWWYYAEMFKRAPLEVDVVVCDAALGEMDVFASRYVIALAKLMLERSDVGLFMYQNCGEQRESSRETIQRRFEARGYRYFRCGGVHVQAASSASPVGLLDQMAEGAPASGETKTAAEFLAIDETLLADSYAFFEFLRLDLE